MTDNKKQRFKKLPEELRRKAILQAAQRCFAQKGFSDTSVQDIADHAQLTKGGVYFHFNSKEAIRDALCLSLTEHIVKALQDQTIQALPPDQRLKQQMTVLLDHMSEGSGFILILSEMVTRHQSNLQCIRAYYQTISEIFTQTLEAGVKDGLFTQDRPTSEQVELILTTLSGLALHREIDASGIHVCQNRYLCIDFLLDIVRKC